MAPSTPADGVAPAADLAASRSTEAVEFADLLVGDDEWVRREFDAIVAAGWGGAPPPCPAPPQGAHWPRRPGYGDRPTPATRPNDRLAWGAAPARQRGPPRSEALRALPASRLAALEVCPSGLEPAYGVIGAPLLEGVEPSEGEPVLPAWMGSCAVHPQLGT